MTNIHPLPRTPEASIDDRLAAFQPRPVRRSSPVATALVTAGVVAGFALLVTCARGETALGCTSDAMIVLDATGSMTKESRMRDARAALAAVVPEAEHHRRLGLVTFGPSTGGGNCSADQTSLHFGPTDNAADAVLETIQRVHPTGPTRLVGSIRVAVDALGPAGGEIVLVTDGHETCGQSILDLAAEIAGQPITVHTIHFRPEAPNAAAFFAQATGGISVNAQTLDDLTDALRATLPCMVIG